jgi:hypothetical protein
MASRAGSVARRGGVTCDDGRNRKVARRAFAIMAGIIAISVGVACTKAGPDAGTSTDDGATDSALPAYVPDCRHVLATDKCAPGAHCGCCLSELPCGSDGTWGAAATCGECPPTPCSSGAAGSCGGSSSGYIGQDPCYGLGGYDSFSGPCSQGYTTNRIHSYGNYFYCCVPSDGGEDGAMPEAAREANAVDGASE